MWIAFDSLYHAQKADALGRLYESVAAGSTRMRLHEPGARKIAHDLRQEARRDVHLFRDLAAAQQPLAVVGKQEHCSDRVVAAFGQI
jgi:hypothetical protein